MVAACALHPDSVVDGNDLKVNWDTLVTRNASKAYIKYTSGLNLESTLMAALSEAYACAFLPGFPALS